MEQQYGVLRVVRVRPPANTSDLQERYPEGWLPEERLVHLLTRNESTIGRALNNDIVLMDPTVSRIHARLTLDAEGWSVINMTAHNVVRVNGQPVPSGQSFPMQPQDIIVLGSTMLQLIAPTTRLTASPARSDVSHAFTEHLPGVQGRATPLGERGRLCALPCPPRLPTLLASRRNLYHRDSSPRPRILPGRMGMGA